MRGLDDELLARYLAGEAGPDERARVEAWAADPAAAGELDRLETAWRRRPAVGRWDVEAAWRRVAPRLDAAPAPRPVLRAWVGYAAAAAALLVAAALLGRSSGEPTVYATAAGAQQVIELSDRSRVILAPASRLVVAAGYDEGAREVSLEGRAWFEVEHDDRRPFRVRTEVALIEDLGTAFEVRAPAGGDVHVAVVEGAVEVRPRGAAGQAMTLGPRDLARVPRGGPPIVRHDAPVESLVGWRAGTLRFDGEPLAEVLRELSRWYGLRFELDSPAVGERALVADVPTADLEEALAILQAALGLEARRQGGVITLAPRGGR